ncbi:uncharacterized protein LOC112343232 isoform X1 [Selaginella moellendorffii]|uniref:uncharacterized protein LOC112343232 isoform X1 n=1 Tax=Selaginella moellendorffii TaxID=88036 RepID=UPI000D1D0A0E|nr:uncharacterized protein LOC112343232 isoform X1 [Selaginella moellendorffii]|eukprot:XP_024522130.1 uncharacterized protein LOC112343232 isoform X1 [Selaginella moellendorffii]
MKRPRRPLELEDGISDADDDGDVGRKAGTRVDSSLDPIDSDTTSEDASLTKLSVQELQEFSSDGGGLPAETSSKFKFEALLAQLGGRHNHLSSDMKPADGSLTLRVLEKSSPEAHLTSTKCEVLETFEAVTAIFDSLPPDVQVGCVVSIHPPCSEC